MYRRDRPNLRQYPLPTYRLMDRADASSKEKENRYHRNSLLSKYE